MNDHPQSDLELQELAEFAASFFGEKPEGFITIGKCSPHILCFRTKDLFEDEISAPILAHLAKREMERRGWHWILSLGYYSASDQPTDYFAEFSRWDKNEEQNYWGEAKHDNEFIALWKAIQATGEK